MASVPTRFGVGPGPVCVIANHVYIVRAPALGAYLETACTCLFAPDSFCPDNFCPPAGTKHYGQQMSTDNKCPALDNKCPRTTNVHGQKLSIPDNKCPRTKNDRTKNVQDCCWTKRVRSGGGDQ